MSATLTEPEIILRALLSNGPRDSRGILAAMAERQFTPKQVRRAREKQGVVIQRAGSGVNMRSTWGLPTVHARDGSAAVIHAHGEQTVAQPAAALVPTAAEKFARAGVAETLHSVRCFADMAPEGLRKYASRDVMSLQGDELRAYAHQVGVTPRDCAGLSEDRLRQNIKLVIAELYELL